MTLIALRAPDSQPPESDDKSPSWPALCIRQAKDPPSPLARGRERIQDRFDPDCARSPETARHPPAVQVTAKPAPPLRFAPAVIGLPRARCVRSSTLLQNRFARHAPPAQPRTAVRSKLISPP